MKYFLSVGEASGDIHAAELIKELRKVDSEAEVVYLGGDLMREAAGCAQSPTETPATIAPTSTDAPAQNTAAEHPTDSDPSPIALSGTRWNLSMVYADGEEQRPSVRYGSVIRQTGAYITFDSDNTFNCVLGLVGCTGTYSTSDSGTTLHITTRYDGTSENGEPCDENTAVTIDPETQVLSFTFNNAKHEFIPD